MAKILCPYCYRHFDSKEALVQCGNDRIGPDGNYECEHSEHSEYARFWGAETLSATSSRLRVAAFSASADSKRSRCAMNAARRISTATYAPIATTVSLPK